MPERDYLLTVPRALATYEYDSSTELLTIDDPVWGECQIGHWPGDRVLIDLYQHRMIQRLAGIEQLSLPEEYSTMPDTTQLTRWEHAWGSVAFVRKMIEKSEAEGRVFDEREKTILQLRTFLSDAGHTAFSHLGDWLLQGFGGHEDEHDLSLLELLRMTGIEEVLNVHSIDLEEVASSGKKDWIEKPSPALCVDRVDYGLREIGRWVDGYPANEMSKPESRFSLVGNELVMSDQRSARYFALAFNLLATEHWSHPTHRLQLQLFAELTKGALADKEYNPPHPKDFLYNVDRDILDSTRTVGTLNNDLYLVMHDIGLNQRRIYTRGRKMDIEMFMHRAMEATDPQQVSFLKPLETHSWQGEYAGVTPPNLEFVPVRQAEELSDFDQREETLDVFLKPLKVRGVDPKYFDESGKIVRLSQTDPVFKRLMKQSRAIQKQAYVARVHLSPHFARPLKEKLQTVNTRWEQSFENRRMDPDEFARVIKFAGHLAILSQPYVRGIDI